MNHRFFKTRVSVYLYKLVIYSLIAVIAVLTVLYYKTQDRKIEGLLAGVATGLLVAVLQLILDWNDHREAEMFKRLRIRQVLPHREGRDYYDRMIETSTCEIEMLGNTGFRFLDDFANKDRQDKASLLGALSRGVRVRFLVPETTIVAGDLQYKARAAQARMAELAKQFHNFEARCMAAQPYHSVVKIDEECLVGPIFPGTATQNTPTVHTYGGSPLAKTYLLYFENEWQKAKPIG